MNFELDEKGTAGKCPETTKPHAEVGFCGYFISDWLRGQDLNLRPLGYEPNELPGCSTPHFQYYGGMSLRSNDARALPQRISLYFVRF